MQLERQYIHVTPLWELALFICDKLNSMLKGLYCYRNGCIMPYPELNPSDILKKSSGREELEFYCGKLVNDNA